MSKTKIFSKKIISVLSTAFLATNFLNLNSTTIKAGPFDTVKKVRPFKSFNTVDLKRIANYLPPSDKDTFSMVSKNSQIAVLSNSIDRTFWDTFSELALKRNDISERIPIVTYADTMKLNTIYERLKDSLYISSMNCPYATVSMDLSILYDLCEDGGCPEIEDLPELPDSLLFVA